MRRQASLAWLGVSALLVHACVLPHFDTDASLDLPASAGTGADTSDAGDGGSGGSGAGPNGGTAGNTEAGAPGGGYPDDFSGVALDEPCEVDQAYACVAPAAHERFMCKDGKWATGEACDLASYCDHDSGECKTIVPECVDLQPGARFCADKDLTKCGPDLVTTSVVETCTDVCVVTGTTAECVPKSCGDKVRQSPEQCDDGNKDDTDACTNACKVAHCGDTAIWKDHETCDDGNTTTEPCEYGKSSCTVCNATCQKAAGVTTYCGDGLAQPDYEECDSESLATQGLCNHDCKDARWALWQMPYLSPTQQNYAYTADIIVDQTTNLEWQRVMDPTERSWADAQKYCWDLVLGNRSDWRLPTQIELISIVDYTKKTGPAVNTTSSAFADAGPTDLWWSSTRPIGTNYAIYLQLAIGQTGVLNPDSATSKAKVRCVR
jgi:cysteine-rich repeat protein